MSLVKIFSSCFKIKPPKKVILILCGSFNPITLMHIEMFQLAKDHLSSLGIEVIGGVISPVHDKYKKPELAPKNHRNTMVRLAISSSNWIRISEWETQQDEWTRTLNVLEHHRNALNFVLKNLNGNTSRVLPSWIPENIPHGSDIEIKLLCGADLLETFGKTDLWEKNEILKILNLFGLVVINRKCSEAKNIISKFGFLKKNRDKIIVVPANSEISSTMTRYNLRQKLSAENILDESIIKYIEKNGLYKELKICKKSKFV